MAALGGERSKVAAGTNVCSELQPNSAKDNDNLTFQTPRRNDIGSVAWSIGAPQIGCPDEGAHPCTVTGGGAQEPSMMLGAVMSGQ